MNQNLEIRSTWQRRIADYKASGLTQKAWCYQNNISCDQLKYWLYKRKPVRKEEASGFHSWLPVSVLPEKNEIRSDNLIIKIGDASIDIHSGFDKKLLADILDVLKNHAE